MDDRWVYCMSTMPMVCVTFLCIIISITVIIQINKRVKKCKLVCFYLMQTPSHRRK